MKDVGEWSPLRRAIITLIQTFHISITKIATASGIPSLTIKAIRKGKEVSIKNSQKLHLALFYSKCRKRINEKLAYKYRNNN